MNLRATDPRAFGPPVWKALHVLAAGYPQHPTESKKQKCCQFLRSIAGMLPCPHCAMHFEDFMQRHDPSAAAESREALEEWMVQAHNAVSRHTRPNRLPWSVARARAAYSEQPAAVPLARVWSGSTTCDRRVDFEFRACESLVRTVAKLMSNAPMLKNRVAVGCGVPRP